MSDDTKHRPGAGRPSALEEARELFVLWGALSQDGSAINVDIAAKRLGVSKETATKLLDLIISSKGNDDDFLSLYYLDDKGHNTVGITPEGSTSGRVLRLTASEYLALVSALDALGVQQDDPLRLKLSDLYDRSWPDVAMVSKRINLARSSVSYDLLRICSKAIIAKRELRFRYQGISDTHPHVRHVVPQTVSYLDGRWLLIAYDLGRRGKRHFRIDRMSSPELLDKAEAPINKAQANTVSSRRNVTLHFADPRYLGLFEWTGLEVKDKDGSLVEATIPYFASDNMWLERHIAACAGAVTTDDPVLNDRIDFYIRSLIDTNAELHPS